MRYAMTTQNSLTTRKITRTRERDNFIPSKIGSTIFVFWRQIFNVAEKISADDFQVLEASSGMAAIWESVEVSNGAFYVVPDVEQSSFLCACENYFEGELSKDAFGIVVTLYALNQLSWALEKYPNWQKRYIEFYYSLRDYALDCHPERINIARAID